MNRRDDTCQRAECEAQGSYLSRGLGGFCREHARELARTSRRVGLRALATALALVALAAGLPSTSLAVAAVVSASGGAVALYDARASEEELTED